MKDEIFTEHLQLISEAVAHAWEYLEEKHQLYEPGSITCQFKAMVWDEENSSWLVMFQEDSAGECLYVTLDQISPPKVSGDIYGYKFDWCLE